MAPALESLSKVAALRGRHGGDLNLQLGLAFHGVKVELGLLRILIEGFHAREDRAKGRTMVRVVDNSTLL